jgi:hypothetical protein
MDRRVPEEASFGKEVGYRPLLGLIWAGLAVALACHFWAADRGLEMTDEASYLLIALDPWGTRGHGTFHGFLLRPLYLLGGSSVVGLRWIGYGILLLVAWRLAGAVRLRLGAGKLAVENFCAPVLMVAAMTAYCAGIRTPCYNWMILVGAILAWSGFLRSGISPVGPLELGIGLTIAILGKWGAALVLLVMFAGVSYSLRGGSMGPKRREWIVALSTMFVGTGIFAIYAGEGGVRDTIQAGILIAKATGSHGWFIVPKYGWEIFYYFYRIVRAFVWLLAAILIFWWLNKQNPLKWPVTKIATILFAAGLSLGALRGWWRGGIEQFSKESVLAGCWLFGVAWTGWAVRRKSKIEERGTGETGGNSAPWPILWALVLTPFLCGIGTNTSIADYAGQGTAFFVAAGVLMLGSLPAVSIQSVAVVSLAGLSLIQASRVSSSLLGMYRLGSVMEQNENLGVGPEAGRLQVDRNTRLQVETIYEIIQRSGFRPGTPVVGVDSLCGWVYLAGGTSPGVPWFQRDQAEYGRQVLARCDVRALRSSWMWIRSSAQMKDPACWWPPQIPAPSWREAGRVALNADRGAENLLLLYQKRDN